MNQQSSHLNNVIDFFLITVFWLEETLCYYKLWDLVEVHCSAQKFIPPPQHIGHRELLPCHTRTELLIPSHNSLMASDSDIILIGCCCCGNRAIGPTEGPFYSNRGVQFLSLLLGLFLQEKSGRGLGCEKDQIPPVHLLKWKKTAFSVWFYMSDSRPHAVFRLRKLLHVADA